MHKFFLQIHKYNTDMYSMDFTEYAKLQLDKVPKFSFDGMDLWCRVVKIYDGDTITGVIKYNDQFYKISIRLDGIDTCEKTSKNPILKSKALQARDRLIELCDFKNDTCYCCMIRISCKGSDKYGRVLADLYKDDKSTVTFQSILLQEKLAYQYGGSTKMTNQQQIEFF